MSYEWMFSLKSINYLRTYQTKSGYWKGELHFEDKSFINQQAYCSVLLKWEFLIMMRASYLQPSSLLFLEGRREQSRQLSF